MALILNIDTSIETASICLSTDGTALSVIQNEDQKNHAAWLHTSIEKIIHDAGYVMKDLQAVAVTSGPGSYTGLRVGMAAAKGLCYALHIPFITENTLKIMAMGTQKQAMKFAASLICPMIDARRMEVYTALYTIDMKELVAPAAMILHKNSFEEYLSQQKMVFSGSGVSKWREIMTNPGAYFVNNPVLAGYLGNISHNKYLTQEFTDLIYSEPMYIKEFYTHGKK